MWKNNNLQSHSQGAGWGKTASSKVVYFPPTEKLFPRNCEGERLFSQISSKIDFKILSKFFLTILILPLFIMQKFFFSIFNVTVFDLESKNDKKPVLKEVTTIRTLHEGTQEMLSRYVSAAYPLQQCRLNKLYLSMASAKIVPADVIENLFFRKTIGDAPISQIISGIYQTHCQWRLLCIIFFIHIKVIFYLFVLHFHVKS